MARRGQHQSFVSAIHWLDKARAPAMPARIIMLAVIAIAAANAQTYDAIYSFKGGADGINPGAVIADQAGALYGTTFTGGMASPICYPYGCGVVYKLDKTGETVLYTFKGGADGGGAGNLIRDSEGNLYGTTYSGGAYSGEFYNDKSGTVFKLDTAGKKTVLHSFGGIHGDGTGPTGLIRDSEGNFYGTTEFGGMGWGWCSSWIRPALRRCCISLAGIRGTEGTPGAWCETPLGTSMASRRLEAHRRGQRASYTS